jgi:hypothetical protein
MISSSPKSGPASAGALVTRVRFVSRLGQHQEALDDCQQEPDNPVSLAM